jgi:hypothetical protein
VTVCTEPFRITAEATARSYGVSEFDYVLTAHPIASLSEAQIRQRAAEIVPEVLRILGVQHDGPSGRSSTTVQHDGPAR